MNIQEISLDLYDKMSLKEKEDFFNKISREQKSECTYTIAIRQRKTKNMKNRGYKQSNGKLTFIEELRRTDKQVTNFSYLCICDCGNWCITTNRHFDIEDTISCGCYHKELSINIAKQLGYKNSLDLKGQVIGDLKVIEKTDKRIHENVIWKCKCINCNTEQEIQGTLLKRGIRIFCEKCSQRKSKGEKLISTLLDIAEIQYIKEYSFINCRYLDTNRPAKFDFYVNNKYIIEFDGEQHFKPEKFGNISENRMKENFIKTQEHDNYKNQWCRENNIPLIRIPYTHIDKLCLEDLLLETSKFIINAEDQSNK